LGGSADAGVGSRDDSTGMTQQRRSLAGLLVAERPLALSRSGA
jgi:hypothetical protein